MKQKLETELKNAGCPYFFDNRCHEEIYDLRFQEYCLDNFKQCETYKKIIKEEK